MFKRDVRLAENTLNKQDDIISEMKVRLLVSLFYESSLITDLTVVR